MGTSKKLNRSQLVTLEKERTVRIYFMNRLRFHQSSYAADFTAEGEDAADFLQSQFSNQLGPFTPGRCTYGLWLDAKGKVQADAWVLQTAEESFRILSEHTKEEALRAHLERHIVADEVEMETSRASIHTLTLIGASATEQVRALGFPVPEDGYFTRGEGVILFCGRRSDLPNYEIIFAEAEADAVTVAKEQLEQAGAKAATTSWMEAQRIAFGVPKVPQEIGPEDLPGEAALVGHAVRLDKGCFLGQEVVARMHNVGRARRGLFRVSGSGEPPQVPAQLVTEDRSVAGTLRSAFSLDAGWEGVALLKLHRVEEDTVLTLENNSVQILARMEPR